MSEETPIVAITGPVKRLKTAWWATSLLVRLHGLKARYVTAKKPNIDGNIRGVILCGGNDIEPEHYGMTGDAGADYDPERDQLEMDVARKALQANIPVLGICRGSQLLNIVQGGNLYQDIRPLRNVTPNRNSILPIKWVDFEADCRLADIYGQNQIKVNSLHNQAIDRIAEPLSAVGWDADGFIQAFENRSALFQVGVQWHPEYLLWSATHRRLFTAFSHAVKKTDNVLYRL
ncbi:hypothetical protein GCM10011297_20440 [Bacterioplanes sanyensis]|uniref:gamma-glutamyl-gamma-aminobutyrate hydrolase family protein n=1 Tax=Bacterioplanes sanyensis TaxID=1249553 RepID=UPI00167B6CD3|nr:type 1 glutamine amidotransferase [Bacterioplanes sanyensis]GGY47544.1 hypothetical protein GCM10011297_20440 [Bacterioplanes sanyensis]